jgi:nitrite reductase/ring-hydroxylating ferredoxin subunit
VSLKSSLKSKVDYVLSFWFFFGRIMNSCDLKPGEAKPVNAFELDLVVFRPLKRGEPIGVLDSVCPHLGADLSDGSVTENGCLSCAFHGWTFDTVSLKTVFVRQSNNFVSFLLLLFRIDYTPHSPQIIRRT